MNYLQDRYANFIVHSMLRLKEGEKLTVHANEETIEFAHTLAHEAADHSGVSVSLVYIENGKVESVDEIAPSFPEKESKFLVMLNLTSFIPSEYREEEEMDAPSLSRHRLLADPIFLDRMLSIPYAVAYVPTARWAQFVYGPGATTDQLYLDLADFLGLDDGIDTTSTLERTLSQRCDELNRMEIDRLVITGPSVELECTLASGARIGTSAMRLPGDRFFYPTFPVEDIIFPVDCRKTEGHFAATYPFRLFDHIEESAEITVHCGKMTSFSCQDAKYVEKYMNIDSLSSSVSEIILCESLSRPALFNRAFGLPLLDRMRSSQVVFGGVTPELITLEDEGKLDQNGLNTGFARLEVPFGSRDLNVDAILKDGRTVTIFEDGLFTL